jgi:hypothetical protein
VLEGKLGQCPFWRGELSKEIVHINRMSSAVSPAAAGTAPGVTHASFSRDGLGNFFEPSPYESKGSYSLKNETILTYNASDPPSATDKLITYAELKLGDIYAFHNNSKESSFQKDIIIINTNTTDIVLFGKGTLIKKTNHNNIGLKMNIAEFRNGPTKYRVFITDTAPPIFIYLAARPAPLSTPLSRERGVVNMRLIELPPEKTAVLTSVIGPRRRKRRTRRHRRS